MSIRQLGLALGILGLTALTAPAAYADIPDNYAGISIQTDDSAFGAFGKYEIVEPSDRFLDGFIDGVSARPAIFFDGEDVNVNAIISADKNIGSLVGLGTDLDVFAGPVVGYDSTENSDEVNVGLGLGADYRISRQFVVNGTAILGSNDSSIRVGIGFGFD